MKLTAETIESYHCPRWQELPGIPLYIDQVVIILEEALGVFVPDAENVVTTTMIHNYVKQKLIRAPVKKKYQKDQLAMLIIVSLFKKVLAISEITVLMELLSQECGLDEAYDLFCEKLEQSLVQAFVQKNSLPLGHLGASTDPEEEGRAIFLLQAAFVALIGKLFVQAYLPSES